MDETERLARAIQRYLERWGYIDISDSRTQDEVQRDEVPEEVRELAREIAELMPDD